MSVLSSHHTVWVGCPGSRPQAERYALDGSMVAEGVDPNDPYATYPLPGAIPSLVSQLIDGPAR